MKPNLVNVLALEIEGDFTDIVLTWHRFVEVVNRLPDITVITSVKHDFPMGGFSGLLLLGESHAAIHTWPELNRAWVELATCGNPDTLDVFRAQVTALWQVTHG